MNVISAEWCMSPGERTSLVLQVARGVAPVRCCCPALARGVADASGPEVGRAGGVGAREAGGRRRPSAMARAAVRLNEVCRETGKLGNWDSGTAVRFAAFQKPRNPAPRGMHTDRQGYRQSACLVAHIGYGREFAALTYTLSLDWRVFGLA